MCAFILYNLLIDDTVIFSWLKNVLNEEDDLKQPVHSDDNRDNRCIQMLPYSLEVRSSIHAEYAIPYQYLSDSIIHLAVALANAKWSSFVYLCVSLQFLQCSITFFLFQLKPSDLNAWLRFLAFFIKSYFFSSQL